MSPESSILNAIMNYGLETLVIAIIINILTAIIKIPIKKLANKRDDRGAVIKKYITFLPVTLGFVLAVAYTFLFVSRISIFNNEFVVLWLTSSSLSLALYAIFEKFFPKKEDDIIYSDDMMYKAYRLIESLSGMDDPKDLKTLTKLVYNKFVEFNAKEEGDYHLIEDVLKGLIPNKSLEAVSKAVFEIMKEKTINNSSEADTEKIAAVNTAAEKIILKGGKQNGN